MIDNVTEAACRITGLVLIKVLEDSISPDEYEFGRNAIVIAPDEIRADNSVKRVHVALEQCAGEILKEYIALGRYEVHLRPFDW
jgi:hypothetical protein